MKKLAALIIVSALFLNCSKEESTQELVNTKTKEVKSISNLRTDPPSETSTVPYIDESQKSIYSFTNVFLEKFNGSFTNPTNWAGFIDTKGQPFWYGGRNYQIKWSNNYAWGTESGKKTNISFPTVFRDKTVFNTPTDEVHCAAISTRGLKEFKYGYFEARMYMPENKKHWGAFWLMPGINHIESMKSPNIVANGGSDGAEIDIAEGNKQNTYSSGLHIDGYKEFVEKSAGDALQTSNGTGQWRVYGVLWTATEIKFYCDGVLKYNFSNKITGLSSPYNTIDYWIPDVNQCIRLNSDALPSADSPTSWLAGIWSINNDRGVVKVDWVKVYRVVNR